jgi:hypothetical protein
MCVVFVLLCPPLFGRSCPGGQGKDEAALILLQQNWAQALERHESETVNCILADEFEDADVDGRLHNREHASPNIGPTPIWERCAQRDEIPHPWRDWLCSRSKPNKRPRWQGHRQGSLTNIFVYRDGRWRAVCGHETLLKN